MGFNSVTPPPAPSNFDTTASNTVNSNITNTGSTPINSNGLIDGISSLFSTVGSVWNSTNNVKAATIKVETLKGELEILKVTNDGKTIDVKTAELALEETKLKEATKLSGYSTALKAVTVLSLMAIALTYIKNPFKKK